MGEEEKKPEAEGKKEEETAKEEGDKKPEEGKDGGGEGDNKAEGDGGVEKKEEEAPPPPPPPPEEVVMRVYMHCDGCARKVQRSLKGFQGVEDVMADSRSHKVVVKGKVAAADPLRVVERVRRKTGRKVELVSPIPEPPKPEEEEKPEEEAPKPEEKEEEPQVVSVVLKVHMHCEACSMEIKRRISKMKGVQAVDTDLKSSEVTVKGVFDPTKLGSYIYRRTGKHAVIVKQDPEPKTEEGGGGGGEEEKKDGAEGEKKEGEEGAKEEEKKDGEDAGKEEEKKEGGADEEGEKQGEEGDEAATVEVIELKRNELLYYYYPRYNVDYHLYTPPPPQIFSDENPNACAIM